MFRKTLIGLAAVAAIATTMGAAATTASANTTIKFGFGFGGYNDGYYNGYDDVTYGSYHCHKKFKWVKVKVVFYDDYGYPHTKWKWVKKVVKFCHYSNH